MVQQIMRSIMTAQGCFFRKKSETCWWENQEILIRASWSTRKATIPTYSLPVNIILRWLATGEGVGLEADSVGSEAKPHAGSSPTIMSAAANQKRNCAGPSRWKEIETTHESFSLHSYTQTVSPALRLHSKIAWVYVQTHNCAQLW